MFLQKIMNPVHVPRAAVMANPVAVLPLLDLTAFRSCGKT